MKELLQYILEQLVSKPENIVIEETDKGNEIEFNVTVDPEDLGSVIGRGGKVANSIRTVVRSSGKKLDKRVSIKFN